MQSRGEQGAVTAEMNTRRKGNELRRSDWRRIAGE